MVSGTPSRELRVEGQSQVHAGEKFSKVIGHMWMKLCVLEESQRSQLGWRGLQSEARELCVCVCMYVCVWKGSCRDDK